MKFAIGTIMNSISIVADGFNNLSDAGSSVISFIGVKMASKPADEDHPFGHERIEYLTGVIISFIITYNQKLDIENKKTFFNSKESLKITSFNRKLGLIIALVFLYVNIKLYNLP